ncbi:hypothetical protein MSTO_14850 [Mycobacterium stomatepiae]|uniref:Uncharacterized protein n=1 Tax=Mycobacterium stomatepiae TaxID=470076 RepID=A0A7I7Q4K5_9MYCO|nr:hypothetical protein MSTO_14850 [Mycobacterium stomatepiae]
MHVASADALLVGDHSELLTDLPIALGVGDGEFVRRDRRQSQRQEPYSTGVGGLRRGASQQGEFSTECGAVGGHTGGGFDLAAAQFQLQIHAPALGLRGDLPIAWRRLAGLGVDEEELFLDAEARYVRHPARQP